MTPALHANDAIAQQRIMVVYADRVARLGLREAIEELGAAVETAYAIPAAVDACEARHVHALLIIGDAEDLSEAHRFRDLGGWAQEMPIVGACTDHVDLTAVRKSGITILIPTGAPGEAIMGALAGSLVECGRAPTWWFE
jgi:hypothetical protein